MSKLKATLASAEVSAGAVAEADQKQISKVTWKTRRGLEVLVCESQAGAICRFVVYVVSDT